MIVIQDILALDIFPYTIEFTGCEVQFGHVCYIHDKLVYATIEVLMPALYMLKSNFVIGTHCLQCKFRRTHVFFFKFSYI